MKKILLTLTIALTTLSHSGYAEAAKKTDAKPNADMGVSKPLEVTGQSRTLSLMTNYNSEKITIGFGNPRKDYRSQILSTIY